MTSVKIAKPCSIEIDGTNHRAKPGDVFELDDAKAARIIGAGFAQPAKPSVEECRALVAEFRSKDPGGDSWQWISANHSNLWRSHVKAFLADDLEGARRTFDRMIELLSRRQEVQPELRAV